VKNVEIIFFSSSSYMEDTS